jgi:hypothetical protein
VAIDRKAALSCQIRRTRARNRYRDLLSLGTKTSLFTEGILRKRYLSFLEAANQPESMSEGGTVAAIVLPPMNDGQIGSPEDAKN